MCVTEPRQLLLGNSLLSLSQDWRRLLLLLWIVSELLGRRKPQGLRALCWGCGHCSSKPWGWAAPGTSPACQHPVQLGKSLNVLILLTLLMRGFASSNAHVQITPVNSLSAKWQLSPRSGLVDKQGYDEWPGRIPAGSQQLQRQPLVSPQCLWLKLSEQRRLTVRSLQEGCCAGRVAELSVLLASGRKPKASWVCFFQQLPCAATDPMANFGCPTGAGKPAQAKYPPLLPPG